MALYLLDSDGFIDYIKEIPHSAALIDGLLQRNETVCVCDIVVTEVYTGLLAADRAAAERLLADCQFLDTSFAAAKKAGEWRFAYLRQGISLALGDSLIAGTAWDHGAIVVTANVRHYPMDEVTVLPLPRH